MRVVIVGAGVVGLCLARGLRRRGLDPLVVERAPAGVYRARPFMLPYHGFDALGDAGVLDAVRAVAWEIAPQADGTPVALAAPFVRVSEILADGIPVAHEREVTGLSRDGGRVTGVRLRDPSGGERDEPADLVVACDGVRSPTRAMAGIDAEISLAEGAHLSFMSPAVIDRPFALHYQADGRQVGLLGWPDGSAGWWDIERCGREAALAPGLDAFRAAFARLIPEAAPALEALTSVEELVYREVEEVRCERWWVPGLVVIGDAAHAVGPEAGLGAGLGLGDALALAVALERSRDPDGACADYELWRRPAVRPYEEIGAAGARVARGGVKPPEEIWPPR
ncbi:MAG TPA: FAD-dependent monooxygenase [Miltoncostaeaceae bacterium]|jgi:2-polyprenyl-6-methoxyphenol hydroxylase-like FAD-dependent oxidoreductase|nr:FAD-dependent monooxygenase [Miltoncostaeaceae bacterium]